jgi:hypothetical protein
MRSRPRETVPPGLRRSWERRKGNDELRVRACPCAALRVGLRAHPSRNGNGTRPTGPRAALTPQPPLPYGTRRSTRRCPRCTGEGEIAARDARPVSPPILPLSARNERGGGRGEGLPAGAVRYPSPSLNCVGHPNPSPEVGGGVDRCCEERAKKRSGERAPAGRADPAVHTTAAVPPSPTQFVGEGRGGGARRSRKPPPPTRYLGLALGTKKRRAPQRTPAALHPAIPRSRQLTGARSGPAGCARW